MVLKFEMQLDPAARGFTNLKLVMNSEGDGIIPDAIYDPPPAILTILPPDDDHS